MTHLPLPLVLVVGFAIGFWAVSALLMARTKAERSTAGDRESTRQRGYRDTGTTSEDTSEANPASHNSQEWFEILGVHADDSFEVIQDSYRRLIRAYHPDRLAGLGPEIIALGEEKAKVINQAFNYAKKLHRL